MQTKYLCSVSETLGVLGLGRTKFYELLKQGEFASVKIGKRRLIRVDSIEAFIDRTTEGDAL